MFLLVATSEDFSALLAAFEQDETFDIASAIAPRINGVKSDASFDFGAASLSRLCKNWRTQRARSRFEGVGEPESLQGGLSGLRYRRLNDKDRIIYEVTSTKQPPMKSLRIL
jgi:Txe/YoeB family toxin of Txe-Axe toxin-antitoxin module